jgi:putative membrane protein
MVWTSIVITAVVWSLFPIGFYSLLIFVPMLFLGYMQYRDAGIGEDRQTLVLRSRLLSKTTAIIKRYRIQAAETKQNPFQQRLNLANYSVTVASGNQGRSFLIRELAESKARDYWTWISNSYLKGSPAMLPDAANANQE